MRIVQFVENLDRGGLERMALDLGAAQKRAGHRVQIYCLHEPGAMAGEAESLGLPVTAFHKKPGPAPAVLARIAWRLRRDRIEAVHTHNPGIHLYAALAARIAGVSVVINTRHSPLKSDGGHYQEGNFLRAMRWTDHVVYVCEHTRRYLVDQRGLPAEPTSVIFNGIDLTKFAGDPARPGSAAGRIRFGTVGRMVPAKGHAYLLDAFASVASRVPGAELRIAGYGELEEQLRAQIQRLGLGERVTIFKVTGAEVAAFYRDLDVFVFSSVNEGLPLAILEAMACGLPAVATTVGGVPEVAPEGKVAWYCRPADAADLARAMMQAAEASPAELAGRGSAARQLAFEQYGLDRMAARYLAVMENIAAARSSHSA